MVEQFFQAANEFGLPWALALALLWMLREQLKHEREDTVPRSVFETEQQQHAEQHGECRDAMSDMHASVNALAGVATKILTILDMRGQA